MTYYRRSEDAITLLVLRATAVVAVVLLIRCGTMSAEAAPVFDNEADFLAAAGAVIIEDFEDEPLVGTGESGGMPTIVFDDFTATSAPPALKVLDIPYHGNHNTTPDGGKYLSADTDTAWTSSEVTLTFDFPISAFGLYLIDVEESVVLTVAGTNYTVPGHGDGGESYFGVIADAAFTEVHMDMGETDSHVSMDDIAYVPEPCSICLLGLGGLVLLRQRR